MKVTGVREIISSLMESPCYFNLSVRERLKLVAHVLQTMNNEHPANGGAYIKR